MKRQRTMASIYKDTARNGYRVQIYVRGVRRQLWIGPVSKTAALAIARHLDEINLARDTGTIPPAESRRWIAAVNDRIRNRLAAWGLIDAAAATKKTERTLGPYLEQLIASRTDWSAGSIRRLTNTRRHLVQQLGADTALAAITPGDATRWALKIRSQFSPSHAGKCIRDARQLFTCAIRDRILAENPFAGIDSSGGHDRNRAAYVPAADALRLIEHAEPYWAAIIALARFAGLRVPSEPLQLRWENIDWAGNRFTVHSPKLIHHEPTRVVPIFPEIRGHLATLAELAPEGSEFCFERFRATAGKTWRANLLRICRLANVKPWPKLWMNLRASCRTDLLERFPGHVVNYWLGHSGQVGAKHYDRIHDGHYAAAVVLPVESFDRISPQSPANQNQKSPGNRGISKAFGED